MGNDNLAPVVRKIEFQWVILQLKSIDRLLLPRILIQVHQPATHWDDD